MDAQWAAHILWLLLYISVLTSGVCALSTDLGVEKLFKNSTLIKGYNVTCDNVRPSDAKFPLDTWVCYNLKVDGLRVRYWYIPGFGAAEECSDGRDKYDSRNELFGICEELMKAHGSKKKLRAAYVNDASCDRSPGGRVIFVKKGDSFVWEKFYGGKGFVITMRCTAAGS